MAKPLRPVLQTGSWRTRWALNTTEPLIVRITGRIKVAHPPRFAFDVIVILRIEGVAIGIHVAERDIWPLRWSQNRHRSWPLGFGSIRENVAGRRSPPRMHQLSHRQR